MILKKNVATALKRGNKDYSTYYWKIPPDLVRLYDIRDGDKWEVKTILETNVIYYERITPNNKREHIAGKR